MNKGNSPCIKPLIIAAEVSLVATIPDAPTIVLTFVTPPIHMEKQRSSDVRGNRYDTIDVGEGGKKEERSTVTEACNSEDSRQSMAPQFIEMSLEVALNRNDFRRLTNSSFLYYASPQVSQIRTNSELTGDELPTAHPGTEVSIYGTNFVEDSDSTKVRLTYDLPLSESDTVANLMLDGNCIEGIIQFIMPDIQMVAAETWAQTSSVRILAEVSFNGIDFSSNKCAFKYQGTP